VDQFLDPLVLTATAPLALFPERFPRAAIVIGLGLLAIPYVVRKANTGRFAATTEANWVLLFLLVVAVPIGAAVSPSFWAVTWPEMVRLVWGMAVCVGVINWCSHGRSSDDGALGGHLALAVAGFLAVGLAFGTVGMLATGTPNKAPLLGALIETVQAQAANLPLLTAAFNPNRVAGLVVLFVGPALALLLAPRPRGRRAGVWLGRQLLLLGFLGFLGVALLLTQSRTALLGAGLAGLVVCLLAGRRGLIPLALLALAAVATLDVFGAQGLVDALSIRGDAGSVVTGSEETPGLLGQVLADRNMAGRLMIWTRAWHGILDQPLTGVGLAYFQQLALEPYPLEGWQPDPDITHAHNLLLQTGLDLGILGLLAFLALLGLAVWSVIRLFRAAAAGTVLRFWAIGLAGGLVAFAVFNTLDAVTLGARPAVAQWYLIGLCLGSPFVLEGA
jgi:putative inorganic carbon (HCO3(-)) transporter